LKFSFINFFKPTWRKVITALIILLVITPLFSMWLYPSRGGGAASGQAYFKINTFWGVYPFVFLGIEKTSTYPCNFRNGETCDAVSRNHLMFAVHGVLSNGDMGGSSIGSSYSLGIFGLMIPDWVDFLLDVIISFIISYVVSCVCFFGFVRIKEHNFAKNNSTKKE
jgi:hypothetical protein